MATRLSLADLAERAGVDRGYAEALVEHGIVTASEGGRFVDTDVRRVRIAQALERGGLALAAIGAAIRSGALSFDFVEQADYDRFAAFGGETFADVSARTGVPVELLLVIRDAMGGAHPHPDDLIRDDEREVVPLLEVQMRIGVRPASAERSLRVMGEAVQRIAETEADWWQHDIQAPLVAAGKTAVEIGELSGTFTPELGRTGDRALLAMWHGQQGNAWLRNIFSGFEYAMTNAGLHTPPDRMPAISFLDLTGYSRLTDERGDAVAAELAQQLAPLVQRTAAANGGRVVKWLGDGVMFHFRDPGRAVVASLEMVDAARTSELPPAHVGVHAGPVVFQGGDYFGRTVNVASRISDYARPGEVVVSQDVVDMAGDQGIAFAEIGPVELKGLTGTVRLFTARRTAG
jgi:class 3 adenylate cyclase